MRNFDQAQEGPPNEHPPQVRGNPGFIERKIPLSGHWTREIRTTAQVHKVNGVAAIFAYGTGTPPCVRGGSIYEFGFPVNRAGWGLGLDSCF